MQYNSLSPKCRYRWRRETISWSIKISHTNGVHCDRDELCEAELGLGRLSWILPGHRDWPRRQCLRVSSQDTSQSRSSLASSTANYIRESILNHWILAWIGTTGSCRKHFGARDFWIFNYAAIDMADWRITAIISNTGFQVEVRVVWTNVRFTWTRPEVDLEYYINPFISATCLY